MNNCDFLGHFQLAPPALFAPTHRKMFVTNLLAEFLNVPYVPRLKTLRLKALRNEWIFMRCDDEVRSLLCRKATRVLCRESLWKSRKRPQASASWYFCWRAVFANSTELYYVLHKIEKELTHQYTIRKDDESLDVRSLDYFHAITLWYIYIVT